MHIDCVKINNDYIKINCLGKDELWVRHYRDINCSYIIKGGYIGKKDNPRGIIDFNCEKETTVEAASSSKDHTVPQVSTAPKVSDKDTDSKELDGKDGIHSQSTAVSSEQPPKNNDETRNAEPTDDHVTIQVDEPESRDSTDANNESYSGNIVAPALENGNREGELRMNLFRQMWRGLFGVRSHGNRLSNTANGDGLQNAGNDGLSNTAHRRGTENGYTTAEQYNLCVRQCRLSNLMCCHRRRVTCLCQCCVCICGTENENNNADEELPQTRRHPLLDGPN